MAGWLIAGLICPLAAAAPPLTEAQRISIIRSLVAEAGIARQALPPDKDGVVIDPRGRILNPGSVQSALTDHGWAARAGDRVVITDIEFKDDSIVVAINGGPQKSHWYDHLMIGLSGSVQAVNKNVAPPHGAQITVKFPDKLPEMAPDQLKQELSSLIDWSPPAEAREMVKPLPAPVKAAIAQHHVLVGMNTDMVIAALGRTGNKDRETDPTTGASYEDWIYGAPPANTVFVRLEGDRVTRVTTYFPQGGQSVDSTPLPALAAMDAGETGSSAVNGEPAGAEQRPTLRRPGDAPPPEMQPGNVGAPLPDGMPPMAPTTPPGGDASTPGGMPPIPSSSSPGGF